MEEWTEDMLDQVEAKILDDSFILSNLNYTHFYEFDPDNYSGSIYSTSIRLYPNGDSWCKRVVTRYYDSNLNAKEISYERDIDESTISKIESKIDLRKLNNNYINEKISGFAEKFELIYNNIYKVTGTLDRKIEELDYLREMLMADDILEDEKKKVSDLL